MTIGTGRDVIILPHVTMHLSHHICHHLSSLSTVISIFRLAADRLDAVVVSAWFIIIFFIIILPDANMAQGLKVRLDLMRVSIVSVNRAETVAMTSNTKTRAMTFAVYKSGSEREKDLQCTVVTQKKDLAAASTFQKQQENQNGHHITTGGCSGNHETLQLPGQTLLTRACLSKSQEFSEDVRAQLVDNQKDKTLLRKVVSKETATRLANALARDSASKRFEADVKATGGGSVHSLRQIMRGRIRARMFRENLKLGYVKRKPSQKTEPDDYFEKSAKDIFVHHEKQDLNRLKQDRPLAERLHRTYGPQQRERRKEKRKQRDAEGKREQKDAGRKRKAGTEKADETGNVGRSALCFHGRSSERQTSSSWASSAAASSAPWRQAKTSPATSTPFPWRKNGRTDSCSKALAAGILMQGAMGQILGIENGPRQAWSTWVFSKLTDKFLHSFTYWIFDQSNQQSTTGGASICEAYVGDQGCPSLADQNGVAGPDLRATLLDQAMWGFIACIFVVLLLVTIYFGLKMMTSQLRKGLETSSVSVNVYNGVHGFSECVRMS